MRTKGDEEENVVQRSSHGLNKAVGKKNYFIL
jgi:hypothetical protein